MYDYDKGPAGDAPQEPLQVAAEVYRAVFEGTESFYDDRDIGGDLAYLLGAIVTDGRCQWRREQAILEILRPAFGTGHPVWNSIELVDG